MKKRLLSAALALAMVLTMLPLTVFATPSAVLSLSNCVDAKGDFKTVAVTWRASGYQFAAATSTTAAVTAPNDGYFFYGKLGTDAANALYEATDGVITGTGGTSGNWYPSAQAAIDANQLSFTLIGDNQNVSGLEKNLSINVKGKNITLTLKDAVTTVTSLTVTNTEAAGAADRADGSVTLGSGGWAIEGANFALNASNTAINGGITVSKKSTETTARTLSVTLTNATVGALTATDGKLTVNSDKTTTNSVVAGITAPKGAAVTLNKTTVGGDISIEGASSSLKATASTIMGAISVNGNNSTITLDNTAAQENLSLTGTGTKLNVTGSRSSIATGSGKQVTLLGSDSATTGTKPAVSVTNGTVGNIVSGSGEKLGCTISVLAGGTIGNVGPMADTAVTVTDSNAGALQLASGGLTVNNGKVGSLTWGAADGAEKPGTFALAVSGANSNVGAVSMTAGTKTSLKSVSISDGTFAGIDLGDYAGRGITGGTFSESLRRNSTKVKYLASSLQYEITSGGSHKYVKDDFQILADEYKKTPTPTICMIAYTGEITEDSKNYIDFKIPKDVISKENETVFKIYGLENYNFKLPDTINGNTVNSWTSGGTAYNGYAPIPAANGTPLELVAATTTVSTNKITEVKVDPSADPAVAGVVAELEDTTIKLSGALELNAGQSQQIPLKIKITNSETEWPVLIWYYHNSKTISISAANDSPFTPVSGSNTMLLNRATVYTIEFSGLTVIENTANVSSADLDGAGSKISAASGITDRASLIEAMKATTADFGASDAVKKAVKLQQAGISEATAKTHINAASRAYLVKHGTPNPTTTQIENNPGGYNMVYVTPFLNVNVTAYNPGNSSAVGTMTLTLSPWSKLVVRGTLGEDYDVNAGSALSLSGSTGDTTVSLVMPDAFMKTGGRDNDYWVHHGNYVYPVTLATTRSGENTVKFTTTHGFSGNFVVNGVAPLVTNGTKGYETLQAAVDDVKNGETINVASAYLGATNVTVSGDARRFTVVFANGLKTAVFTGAEATQAVNGTYVVTRTDTSTAPVQVAITVGTAANGSMTANPTSAVAGATVTLTAKPNDNYTANAPTVKTDTGATVPLTASTTTKGVWTFIVPSGATKITVTPAFTMTNGLPFTDVVANSWYYESVAYCYNTTVSGNIRLMEGFNTTTFGIGRSLTRADVVTIMWNLRGRPSAGAATAKSTFSDVASGAWYYNAVTWAANNGYANGYGDGRFGPNDPVLRDELATFLWRFANSPKVNTNLAGYTDGGRVLDWAQDAMRWAAGLNILSGTSSVALNGTLSPRTAAYREQVAVTVRQYHQRYVNN